MTDREAIEALTRIVETHNMTFEAALEISNSIVSKMLKMQEEIDTLRELFGKEG